MVCVHQSIKVTTQIIKSLFLQHSHHTLLWKASVLLKGFLVFTSRGVSLSCVYTLLSTHKVHMWPEWPSRKLFAFKLMETFFKKLLSLLSFKTKFAICNLSFKPFYDTLCIFHHASISFQVQINIQDCWNKIWSSLID